MFRDENKRYIQMLSSPWPPQEGEMAQPQLASPEPLVSKHQTQNRFVAAPPRVRRTPMEKINITNYGLRRLLTKTSRLCAFACPKDSYGEINQKKKDSRTKNQDRICLHSSIFTLASKLCVAAPPRESFYYLRLKNFAPLRLCVK